MPEHLLAGLKSEQLAVLGGARTDQQEDGRTGQNCANKHRESFVLKDDSTVSRPHRGA